MSTSPTHLDLNPDLVVKTEPDNSFEDPLTSINEVNCTYVEDIKIKNESLLSALDREEQSDALSLPCSLSSDGIEASSRKYRKCLHYKLNSSGNRDNEYRCPTFCQEDKSYNYENKLPTRRKTVGVDLETTGRFLETVKENEVLYNMKVNGYKNSRLTNQKWEEIGSMFGVTGEVIKKKWKGLRDSYNKHLRSLKAQAAKNLNRYKSWPWAHQMSFLKPHLEYAATESSVSSIELQDAENEDDANHDENGVCYTTKQDNELNVSHIEMETTTQDKNSFTRSERRNRNSTTLGPSNADKVISYLQSIKPQQQDDIDLMFLSFAKTVKKFSPQRKAITKAKLAQYLMDQELADLQEKAEYISSRITTQTSSHSNDSISSGSNLSNI